MKVSTAALILAAAGVAPGTAVAAPDWSSVPSKDVMLFYPGQSSWEWLLTPSDHPGADKFRAGKNCAACHIGDETNMGALLVSGKKNETSPIPGKPGSISAKVQFAHDAQSLYVRLVISEGNQPNAKMDSSYDTRVTMMLDGGGVVEANRAGCFAACHADAAGMPAAGGSDRTMYLPKTRAKLTAQGGGDALAGNLAQLKSSGYQLEYWQAKLNPGSPAAAASGVIFDKMDESKPTDVTAEATNAGGTWTVVLSRKLNGGVVSLAPGKTYTVAFAVHAGHTNKRFHYVSFERTLALDSGSADFVAK
jgi:cytochrome c-type protein NapC